MSKTHFLNWLAGFIDGEGCFVINKDGGSGARCCFYLKVRDDDAAILYEILEQTGIGKVYPYKARPGRQAQVSWQVQSRSDCMALVALLQAHPLRAKKARDFVIWAEAVELWQALKPIDMTGTRGGTRPPENVEVFRRMAILRNTLMDVRRYPTALAAVA